MKGDDIAERLVEYSVRIIHLVEALPRSLAGRHIGGQLLRCGTSPGANYEEARGGESRADFIHKLGVTWKEVRESGYWIRVVQRALQVEPGLVADLLRETHELSSILGKSIKTAKSRNPAAD